MSQDLLDKPFLELSPHDALTLREACEGIHIWGGTGSGKTSGSGQTIAMEYLSLGMGGLVLTAKKDELDTWREYMEIAKREDDLIIFDMNNPHRFNFMDYEFSREGEGAGQAINIVDMLLDVGGMSESESSNPYFENAARRMLTNAVEFCQLGLGRVRLEDIIEIIRTAPRKPEQTETDTEQCEALKKTLCYEALVGLSEKEENGELSPVELRISEEIGRYWFEQFMQEGGENTLNSIISTLYNVTDMFQRGTLYELFCTETTITPEDTFNGKVIVVNLPLQEYRKQGEISQQIFKTMWQYAIQRRTVALDTLPAFLWVDEAQLFLTHHDQEYMTTARSARAATVYLSQNYPNYLARMGGFTPIVESLLGNFQTKIFHQNTDPATNEWASRQIGEVYKEKRTTSGGGGLSEMGRNISHGFSTSEERQSQVLPMEFTTLKKGGFANDRQVESIVLSGGKQWQVNHKNYLRTAFTQPTREG